MVAPARIASRTGSEYDVLIVGAGVTGLASALAIANCGLHVCVIEKRLDPTSEESQRRLQTATELIGEANRNLHDLPLAKRILDEAQGIRSQMWGSRLRNVLLDTWSIALLRQLGVDAESFPQIREMNLSWGHHYPKIHAQYAGNDRIDQHGVLDPSEMVFRRDWKSQPGLHELERALCNVAASYPNIKLLFGFDTQAVDVQPTQIAIESNSVSNVAARIMVIADGGNTGILAPNRSSQVNVSAREPLELTAITLDQSNDRDPEDVRTAFGDGHITPTGWRAVAGNDSLATVQISNNAITHDFESFHYALEKGLKGTVIELAVKTTGTMEQIETCFPFENVMIAGDAAMRGTPLLGLGAQFGLLWSQYVCDFATSQLGARTKRPSQIGRSQLEQQTTAASRTRMDFERSCLQVVENVKNKVADLGAAGMTVALSESISAFEFEFQRIGNRASMQLDFVADLDLLQPSSEGSLIGAVSGLRDVTTTMTIDFDVNRTAATGIIGPTQKIEIQTSVEQISVNAGEFCLTTNDAALEFGISDAVISRCSSVHDENSSFQTVREIRSLAISLPNSYLDTAFEKLIADPNVINESTSQRRFTLELIGGRILELGPVAFQAVGNTTISVTLDRVSNDCQKFAIAFERGWARPVGLSRLMPGVAPAINQALRSSSRSTKWFDVGARAAARYVNAIEVCTSPDGTGSITYLGPMKSTFAFTHDEFGRLRQRCLHLSPLIRQLFATNSPIRKFEVHASL